VTSQADVLVAGAGLAGLHTATRLAALGHGVLLVERRAGPQAMDRYDGAALRARFRGRITLRRMLAQVRTPAVASAAFLGLRTPPGRAAARAVLFGDRSFPDAPPPVRAGASVSRRT